MKTYSAMLGMALTTLVPAFAQCPDPLDGKRWTFNAQATAMAEGPGIIARDAIRRTNVDHDFAIAGQFAAANGRLNILATSIIDRTSTRLERDAGSYSINANCSGGTLIMNLSSYPMQYDFWFFNGGRSLYMVSIRHGRPATGSATLAPTGCPAGVTDPLAVVTGEYALKLQGLIEDPFAFALAGVMKASGARVGLASWLQVGGLEIFATSDRGRGGSVTRLERDAGNYQVAADCTYGTLNFNLSSFPVQYDFFFQEGFSTADVISTSRGRIFGVFNR